MFSIILFRANKILINIGEFIPESAQKRLKRFTRYGHYAGEVEDINDKQSRSCP